MSEPTCISTTIEQGEAHGGKELLPLVYGELRRLTASRLSREVPGQASRGTALVHESWLRFAGVGPRFYRVSVGNGTQKNQT